MWNDPLEPFLGLAFPVGLLFCFRGASLVRLAISAAAFVAVGVVCGGLADAAGVRPSWTLVAGGIGGLAGAVLFQRFFSIGVFALGASAGAVLGLAAAGQWGRETPPAVLGIASAVVGGFLALGIRGVALSMMTAVLGGWMATASALHFTAGVDIPGEFSGWGRLPWPWGLAAMLTWGVLAAGGAISQWRSRIKE